MSVFAGLKVIEVGSGVALSYCGKIFADFGAEVVKAEPRGGDALRSMEPLLETSQGLESGYFAWLNTNKKSITADASIAADANRLRALIAAADVLLDGRSPAEIDASPLRHDVSNTQGNLIITAMSWFGETGPYRDFKATDSVCRALGGGVWNVGPVEGPPLIVPDGQSGILGGLAAFVASAAGLYGRSGGARRMSVSVMEVITHLLQTDVFRSELRRRGGINKFGKHYPSSIYETANGYLGTVTLTPAQWKGVCEMIGRPDLAKETRFATNADRVAHIEELEAIFRPAFMAKPAAEWFEEALRRRLAVVIVPTMDELLKQRVHRERGVFASVAIDDRVFEGPILPQRLTKSPPSATGRAPLAGQHNADFQATAAVAKPARAAMRPPLEGVRIVDLSMGWAGPLVTRQMADLGAEVIKVESCGYPDWWRGAETNQAFFDERKYEQNEGFNFINRNKLGITLDLTSDRGKSLLRRLVAKSHAVVENYAADVLPKLGLDYSVLSRANPAIVMMSMPCFASKGLWSEARAYGSTLEQASGLPTISGRAEDPPTISAWGYGDPVGGFNGAAGLMLGLLHQQRTGEGQFIDQAHVAGMMTLAAPQLIEQSATGALRPRIGNRHRSYVPHGAFQCAGDDRWIVVAITDDSEWKSLSSVIGLAHRPEFSTVEGRRKGEDEIDKAIAEWTRQRTAERAMEMLQANGIAAARASNAVDVTEDRHLVERGFWQTIQRAYVGSYKMDSAPYREASSPYPARFAAPTLGQHNTQVLGGILGLSSDEIRGLEESGIIGTTLIDSRKAVSAA